MNASEVLELAKRINEKHGKVSVFRGGSWFDLTPELVVSFLAKDGLEFTAELFHTTKDIVKAWKDHFLDLQCQAKNVTGIRCRNQRDFTYSLDGFDPDQDEYHFCKIHLRSGSGSVKNG